MSDIYRNSYLTIAATCAANPRDGFLRTPSSFKIGPVSTWEFSFHLHKLRDPRPSPLLTRAWAYQERILAPRVLHVGGEEIMWECFDTRVCEFGCQLDEMMTWDMAVKSMVSNTLRR